MTDDNREKDLWRQRSWAILHGAERFGFDAKRRLNRPDLFDLHGRGNSSLHCLQCHQGTRALVIRTWTAQLRERGICINTISLGLDDTPIIDSLAAPRKVPTQSRSFAAATPLSRIGRPEGARIDHYRAEVKEKTWDPNLVCELNRIPAARLWASTKPG